MQAHSLMQRIFSSPTFKHFASTRILVTERSFDTGFSLLDTTFCPLIPAGPQANVSWYTPYLLLEHLPFLSRKAFDEALHLRSIVIYGGRPYTEIGYSIGFSDRTRIGVFAGFDCLKFHSVGVSLSLPLSLFADK